MVTAHEKRRRLVVKSVAYRALSVSVGSLVAYYFTHNIATSAFIVALVNGYNTILYYVHERIWAHIRWGKRER